MKLLSIFFMTFCLNHLACAEGIFSFSQRWTSIEKNPNETYLSRLSAPKELERPLLTQEDLMNSKKARELKQQYQDMTREYHQKKAFSTAGLNEEQTYLQRAREFAQFIFRTVLNRQITNNVKKVEKKSKQLQMVRKVHSAVTNVVSGATQVNVSKRFRLGAKTNLPNQKGQLWVASDIVDAQFDLDLAAQQRDSAGRPIEQEKYRLSVQRGLPVLSLHSSLSYGIETTRVTASISRPILPNLSASVQSTHLLNSLKTAGGVEEESVRLSYGIRF
tara:strand:- start:2063 stop:2887 length:825 start_codon:yes stop_codon:yes gene_type:complete